MATMQHSTLVDALAALADPRRQCNNLKHRLVDILVIAFCAVLSGCDDFVEIEQFARAKELFFRRFLELPAGIPSHDTFRRVFQAVSSSALQSCLIGWLSAARRGRSEPSAHAKPLVAMDGKTLRRTFESASGLKALHLVSAWAADHGITLGQVATEEKSNEITALPQLIDLLDLKDCVVTIDAAGCQKKIAQALVEKGADYVLALKGNQETLHGEVAQYFERQLAQDRPDAKVRSQRQVETGHGRTETRDTMVAALPKSLASAAAWVGLATIVMVVRESVDHATKKVSSDVRYFISSLPAKVKQMAGAVRSHWGIENGLHWVLDVAFNEDRMRLRDRNAIQNLALLNRLAVSVLRADSTVRAGVKCKRKKAGWDDDYLLQLLLAGP